MKIEKIKAETCWLLGYIDFVLRNTAEDVSNYYWAIFGNSDKQLIDRGMQLSINNILWMPLKRLSSLNSFILLYLIPKKPLYMEDLDELISALTYQ